MTGGTINKQMKTIQALRDNYRLKEYHAKIKMQIL